MSTVWTFGDSLTEGFKSNDLWARTYVQWKGYVPLTYGEIIAEKLNYKITNLGKGGSDNYSIFETFCKNVNDFKKNDIVIIGWSDVGRFRLTNKNSRWTSLVPNFSNMIDNIDNITQNTIDEIFVNRMSENYVNEVNSWIELINKLSNEIKIINWSTFNNGKINGIFIGDIELIFNETKGEVKDSHFSEKGQMTVAQTIINKINYKNKSVI